MNPKGIVLHFTASAFGDRNQIDQWHKQNGWSGIGYHYVILNGKRKNGDNYNPQIDGVLERGRTANIKGAHCKANGMNECTIGISSIGDTNRLPSGAVPAGADMVTATYLTKKQLDILVNTAARVCLKFGLKPSGTFIHPVSGKEYPVITQHSDHDSGKPFCASLKLANVRQLIVNRVDELKKQGVPMLESDSDLEADPESVEATLPEFTSEIGSAEGPEDLEMDIKHEFQ